MLQKQSLAMEENSLLYEKLLDSDDGEYPDYFAGTYINDDGELVVCLTEDSKKLESKVYEAAGSDSVHIQIAKHSWEELSECSDMFNEIYESAYDQYVDQGNGVEQAQEYAELLQAISGWYISQKNNCIVVEITGLDQKKEALFRELFADADFLRFEEGGQCVPTESWLCGQGIYSSTDSFSSGYRAYWYAADGTKYTGFTTAGHAAQVGDYIYASDKLSTPLGICKASQFSGNTDCAFVAILHPGYTPSNQVYYNQDGNKGGVMLNTSMVKVTAIEGSLLYKSGADSKLTHGEVVATDASLRYGGKTINDLVKTGAKSLAGDSGGVAYVIYTSENVVTGTMAVSQYNGTSLTDSTFTYSYVSKATNAKNNIGAYLY